MDDSLGTIRADADRLPQLLENLFRSPIEHGQPGYSTEEAGSGFGLYIVREIAHEHGRDVSITDRTEGGARFEFTGVASA